MPAPKRTMRLRGRAGMRQRSRRLARSNGLCELCLPDRITLATEVDHILPLALGGADTDENTRNLCRACHERVTAEQFGRTYRPKPFYGLDGWPID